MFFFSSSCLEKKHKRREMTREWEMDFDVKGMETEGNKIEFFV